MGELGSRADDIEAFVPAPGERDGGPGFTFSDLTQRLIPAIVLDAYPHRPIVASRAIEIAEQMVPTPPFTDKRSGER
jgi:hypothetical protein